MDIGLLVIRQKRDWTSGCQCQHAFFLSLLVVLGLLILYFQTERPFSQSIGWVPDGLRASSVIHERNSRFCCLWHARNAPLAVANQKTKTLEPANTGDCPKKIQDVKRD